MPAPLPSLSAAPTPTEATEIVTRPEPGLARGRWEAPAWAFWAMLAVILSAALAYLLHRAGWLRRSRGDVALPRSTRAKLGRP